MNICNCNCTRSEHMKATPRSCSVSVLTTMVGFALLRFSAVRATRFAIPGGSDACEQNLKDEQHEGKPSLASRAQAVRNRSMSRMSFHISVFPFFNHLAPAPLRLTTLTKRTPTFRSLFPKFWCPMFADLTERTPDFAAC